MDGPAATCEQSLPCERLEKHFSTSFNKAFFLQNHENVDRKKLKTFRALLRLSALFSHSSHVHRGCLLCCWWQGSLFSPLHGNGRDFRTSVEVKKVILQEKN